MNTNFNDSFNDKGEKPRFIHKPNPIVERSFQIFEFQENKKSYEPVGEYIVIDDSEDIDITEKKMFNLMSIMNGKKNLIDFKSLTNTRILYNIIPRAEDSTQQKIIFRTHDGQSISKENAVLTLEKGVFDETD